LSRRSSQHLGSLCRPLCWPSRRGMVVLRRHPRHRHPAMKERTLTGSKKQLKTLAGFAENTGRKGDRGAPWSYWCHRLVAPQDCGLGCCLACGTPVGSGSRFGPRGCGLLSPDVANYGITYCRDGEKSFVLSCVSSFCASAGFSVCDSPRCEACDEVIIEGLSAELASVNGSF